MNWQNVFKIGNHRALSGDQRDYSAADLQEIAESYNPELHKAPILMGHDESKPALGFVDQVATAANKFLQVLVGERTPAYDQAFAEGLGLPPKGVSIALYDRTDPYNPTPGKYYLRHVSLEHFPAVKGEGLGFAFADGSKPLILEFAEEEALTPSPSPTGELEGKTQPTPLPEPPPPDEDDDPTLPGVGKSKLDFSERSELAALRQRVAALEAEKKQKQYLAFVEEQVAAGRLRPGQKERVIAVMTCLEQSGALQFSEGEKQVSEPALQVFQDFVAALPKQIEFSEVMVSEPLEHRGSGRVKLPAGVSVDPEKLQFAEQVAAYKKDHDCSWVVAEAAVRGRG